MFVVGADTKQIKDHLAVHALPGNLEPEPRVVVDFDEDEDEAARRRKLLTKCTQRDLHQVDELVKKRYRHERNSLSSSFRQQVVTEPDAEYHAEHYQLTLEELSIVCLKPRFSSSNSWFRYKGACIM